MDDMTDIQNVFFFLVDLSSVLYVEHGIPTVIVG